MAFDSLIPPLLQVPLFRGLKPLQVTEIARRAERTVYRPGDTLIEEGGDADAAILIVSGEAVRVSGPTGFGRAESVPAGALLAEMGMLIETQHSSTVVARTSIRALRITRADMIEQMADDPDLADHLVQRIASRLTALAKELRAIDSRLGPPSEMPVTDKPAPVPARAEAASAALH